MTITNKMINEIEELKDKLHYEMQQCESINYKMFNYALRIIRVQDKYIKILEEYIEE